MQVITFASHPGALALGGHESKLAGSVGPGAMGVKGKHQALVSALNLQISKVTTEMEQIKGQIETERQRYGRDG